ncbi:cation diffusion facilitator family transporter [Brachybacterium sp. GPGPB12]|uniref:cation diffusion facilitator family transporter n=1 Tax=Brachybacterium sp. GPGPB12 TaxID=3023517 RepID=UPI0031346532
MTASHTHDHGHSHASPTTGRTRLAIAFGLTALIVLAQAVGGVVTGSLALLTDTAHALVDASGLLVALIAATMLAAPREPDPHLGLRPDRGARGAGPGDSADRRRHLHRGRGSRRLASPPEIASTEPLVFGAVGLAVNLVAILVLAGGKDTSLNMKAAFLEVANDALGSLGVIVAALVIRFTGFQQADALAGLFIAALIVPRAVRILRDTLRILMEYTPEGVDLDEVREHLLALEHVQDVHDLHASNVGSEPADPLRPPGGGRGVLRLGACDGDPRGGPRVRADPLPRRLRARHHPDGEPRRAGPRGRPPPACLSRARSSRRSTRRHPLTDRTAWSVLAA